MRREWRWGIAAAIALTAGALCAQLYVTVTAPYYRMVARLIAQAHPWEIVSVEVEPGTVGSGNLLRLVGLVRVRSDDAQPAAKLVGKLQVAAVVESPVIFWTLLFVWPAVSIRQRLACIALGFPVFLGLEAATTVCQLLSPLAYASAVLAGESSPITPWEHWSRFVEGGGRAALAVLAAMVPIAITRIDNGGSELCKRPAH